MKKIFCAILTIVFLGITNLAFADIDGWRLGSMGTNNPTKAEALVATTTNNNNYMTLETPVGTDHSVAAVSKFYITKIDVEISAAGLGIWFGYADDGVADGGAPTNPVQMSNEYTPTATDVTISYDVFIEVPAGKYPLVRQNNVGGSIFITAYGVLIAD